MKIDKFVCTNVCTNFIQAKTRSSELRAPPTKVRTGALLARSHPNSRAEKVINLVKDIVPAGGNFEYKKPQLRALS
jgi:hypothetical protein